MFDPEYYGEYSQILFGINILIGLVCIFIAVKEIQGTQQWLL